MKPESMATGMLLPDTYTIRFEGVRAAVAFKDSHWKVITKEILPQARAQLEATMKAYCKDGPADIPPQRFRFEIQYSSAGKNVRVEAFKTRHVRVYGAAVAIDGRSTFLVTGMDVAKKSDRADQDILKAAGKAAHQLIHSAKKK